MSEVFDGYERQYCEISASLSRKCASAALLGGEKKKQKVSEIKSGLEDAENLIRKMNLEARSLRPSIKAGLLANCKRRAAGVGDGWLILHWRFDRSLLIKGQDLHQQGQPLLHAHVTLHGVDDNISKSKRILTAM
ncbi:hypothetical protein OPV22_008271 [Ensete ventricosum]|uniref:Vesicle transport v-SNARE N-terminal domain-containing protein n=1 Tax=Ensete ventricosum TaxID=4639 RepID=A0AAV8R7X4_ENSVE|nr:hypothetical protein OPV22_008271 [Ensete ventricosum]